MREIKFRAWDGKSKKIRKVDSIAFDENGEIKVVNIWGYDIIEQKDIIIHLSTKKELKRVVLLQCTGLKDRNGKEIYEGDIVIQNPMTVSNLYPIIGVVKFNEGSYWIENGKDARVLFTEIDTNEILGTIYQNAELLEEAEQMGCKCGGKLIRIATDCYECKSCGVKYAAAFAQLPAEKNAEIKIDFSINSNVRKEITESIQKEIIKGLRASRNTIDR